MEGKIAPLGLTLEDINSSMSLTQSGVLDSFGFLEFISEIEDEFDVEFDFGELDPSEFTTIASLVDYITTNKNA